MGPKKVNHKQIETEKYVFFYDKAKQFRNAMITEFEFENWAGSALSAVHCVISANDALLTKEKGICSSSKDHMDAITLFTGNINFPGTKQASNHMRQVIALKNTIAYEAKPFTEKQATNIKNHAVKFFDWVTEQLGIPKTEL
jgi:hypothetical protein